MPKKSLLIAFTAAVLTLIFAGCETPDDNNIQQARSCVDAAGRLDAVSPTSAEGSTGYASTCETMVQNMTSPEAGRIGFGAVLIEMGMISKITQMAQSLTSNSNQMSGAVVAVAQCPATSGTICSTVTAANRLVTYATQSGSNGAMKIALFVQMAQLANSVTTITNQASAASALGNLASTPTSATSIAAANSIVQAQQQACAGSGSTSSLCQQLTAAIGGATDTATILTNASNYVSTH